MNYLELINKCLLELNYKQVRSFDELIKTDHKKIKNILNIINAEICMFDNWNFLLRRKVLSLPANMSEIVNNVNGKFHMLSIDGKKLEYTQNFEDFILNGQSSSEYSVLNDVLLLPKYNTDKNVNIIYYSNDIVKAEDGSEKTNLEFATDSPLIPEPFVEPLLVYGTCMRMKANPEYGKFPYWMSMYKENLATMRSKLCTDALQCPTISLKRT